MASYTLRIELHTEFLSISFAETGLRAKNGLAADAFNETELSCMPFSWARNAPAVMFHSWKGNRYAAYRKRGCYKFFKVVEGRQNRDLSQSMDERAKH